MIDSVLNLIFRCSHRRLTSPVTPLGKDGKPHGETYVACLDCGKHFGYDLKKMRIGKPLSNSTEKAVMPPGMPSPRKSRLKLTVMALGVPFAIVMGSMLRSKHKGDDTAGQNDKPDRIG